MKLVKVLGILTLGTLLMTACDRKVESTRTSSTIENQNALPAEQTGAVYDETATDGNLQAEEARPTREVFDEPAGIQAEEERTYDRVEDRNQYPDNSSSEPDPDQMSN